MASSPLSAGISPSAPHSESLQCALCDQQFPTKTSLGSHMFTHSEHVPTKKSTEPQLFRPDVEHHLPTEHRTTLPHSERVPTNEPLVCQFCTEPQLSSPDLERHLSTEHRHYLSCHLCEYFSTKQPDLYKHYISSHTMQAFTAYRNDLSKHINSVLLAHKSNQCFMCTKSFKNLLSLQMHVFASHFKYTNFTCPTCHLGFDSKEELEAHAAETHVVRTVGKLHQDFSRKLSLLCLNHRLDEHNSKKEYILKINSSCYVNISSLEDITSHFKQHHRSLCICEACGLDLTTLDSKPSLRSEVSVNPEVFHCPSCAKEFSNKSTLCCHLAACDTLGFACMTCGFISKSDSVMKIHVLKCPGDPKKQVRMWLKCTYCPKSFTGVFPFRRHLVNCFKTVRQCVLCSYKGQERKRCNCHLSNTHKVEILDSKLIILCDHCKNQFDSSETYKEHLKSCFLSVLQCNICQFVTNLEEKNRLHVMKHFEESKIESENSKRLENNKNYTKNDAPVKPRNAGRNMDKIYQNESDKCKNLDQPKRDSVLSVSIQPEFVDCNDEVPYSMSNRGHNSLADPLDKSVSNRSCNFAENVDFVKSEIGVEPDFFEVKEERLTPPPLNSILSVPLLDNSTPKTGSSPNVSSQVILQNSPTFSAYQFFTPKLQPLPISAISKVPNLSGTSKNAFSVTSPTLFPNPQTSVKYPSMTLTISQISAAEVLKNPSEVATSSLSINNTISLNNESKIETRSLRSCKLCSNRIAVTSNRHYVIHHALSVRCFCKTQLTDVQDMEVHLTQQHNITDTNLILKRILFRGGYLRITKHVQNFLLCPFCEQIHSCLTSFYTHLICIHKNFCRECGVIFNGEKSIPTQHLVWHYKTHTTGITRNRIISPPSLCFEEIQTSDLDKMDSVQCPLCMFCHENKMALRDHVAGHVVEDCTSCLNSFLVPRAQSESGQCTECVSSCRQAVSQMSLHAVTIQQQSLHTNSSKN